MWWQISKFSKITNIQQPLLNYRHHEKQTTQKKHNKKHIEKGRCFLDERLNDLKVSLNSDQKNLILKYIYGNLSFNDLELNDFISLSRKIILDVESSNPQIVKATRLVMAKAILYILNVSNKSSSINKSKAYYTRKAYMSGCMPTIWYIKSRIHQILKK